MDFISYAKNAALATSLLGKHVADKHRIAAGLVVFKSIIVGRNFAFDEALRVASVSNLVEHYSALLCAKLLAIDYTAVKRNRRGYVMYGFHPAFNLERIDARLNQLRHIF